MRPHVRRLSACVLAALVLAGCSAPGGGINLPGLPGAPAGPTISPDPAPSAMNFDRQLSLRLDQVRRSGLSVGLDFTVGNGDKNPKTFNSGDYGSDWAITTNTGIKITEAKSSDRRLEGLTGAAVTLDVPLPDAAVTSLTVKLDDATTVTVPVPAKDGAVAYLPAKLRQVGLAPVPIRDGDHTDLVLETVRSEGLFTDVTYSASAVMQSWYDFSTDLCPYAGQCALQEADGTKHPLVGDTDSFKGRAKGTLRFLGELKPDNTALKLTLRADSKESIVDVTLPSHADSPAQAVAGSLTRPSQTANLTMTAPKYGTTVTVDRVDVLSDHTQVHLIAKGGTREFDLNAWDKAALVEPSGVVHPLQEPASAKLVVPVGGSLDTTLVFTRATPADVTSFTIALGWTYNDELMSGTLTIPVAPDANPPAGGATLGQLEKSAPAPVVTAGPTPTPTAQRTAGDKTEKLWSYTAFNTSKLPVTTLTQFGRIKSAIKGVGLASQTASAPDVDPGAAEAAERSLKDLGAKQTPDGLVLTLPETVLFDVDKFDLKPDAQATLTKVATLLKYYDKAKIGVQGHTDSTGTADHNLELSKNRAQAVATALTAGGVASSRMTVTGFGLTKPVASNDTDAGRAQNRRVEIVLTETG